MNKLLSIWPTVAAIADDLGLPYPTVAAWSQRGIPPRRFKQIIAAAEKRGKVLTFESLLEPDGEPAPPLSPEEDAA